MNKKITTYAKNFEDIILWNVFKDIKKGFYIDIGAADPEINSVTKLFYDNGWRGINVEPSYEFFSKHKRFRPKDINLNFFVGKYDNKSIDFRDLSDNNLLFHKTSLRTLNSILDDYELTNINLMKISPSNSLEDILKGFDLNLFKPSVILVSSKNNNHLLKSDLYELVLQYDENLFYLLKTKKELKHLFTLNCLTNFKVNITKNHFLAQNINEKQVEFDKTLSSIPKLMSKIVSNVKSIFKKKLNIYFSKILLVIIQLALFCKKSLIEVYRHSTNLFSNNEKHKITKSTTRKKHILLDKSKTKQLFLDVSVISKQDNKTGVHRVVRNILQEIVISPPVGYRVEPVYAKPFRGYFYAKKFTANLFGFKQTDNDSIIKFNEGDVFLGLDYSINDVLNNQSFFKTLYRDNIKTYFIVHDLLPINQPQYFPLGMKMIFSKWLQIISKSDGIICVSNSTAVDFHTWLKETEFLHRRSNNPRKFKISWFHLGANINNDIKASNSDEVNETIIFKIQKKITFLMVSTIEPRKGHDQALKAFEKLWDDGFDLNLIIVGRPGWKVSKLIKKINSHKELNNRLFWLNGISDVYLQQVYKCSSCLLIASEGEGFGLPLIEAAKNNIPIIARDLDVFREIASNNIYYFEDSLDSEVIFNAVKNWLYLFSNSDKIPNSSRINFQNWYNSSRQLLEAIGI